MAIEAKFLLDLSKGMFECHVSLLHVGPGSNTTVLRLELNEFWWGLISVKRIQAHADMWCGWSVESGWRDEGGKGVEARWACISSLAVLRKGCGTRYIGRVNAFPFKFRYLDAGTMCKLSQ